MIDVMIVRHGADKRGEDVIEPLVGSLATAIALGRSKLDAQAEKMQPVTIVAIYRDDLRRGMLLDCVDAFRGEWVGMIKGINHRTARGVTKTTLRVLRVAIESAS